MPLRQPQPEDAQFKPFPEAEQAPPLGLDVLRSPTDNWVLQTDVATGTHQSIHTVDDGKTSQVETGNEVGGRRANIYTIKYGDPLSATMRCERTYEIGRGDWQTRIETVSVLTGDTTTFRVTNVLDARL